MIHVKGAQDTHSCKLIYLPQLSGSLLKLDLFYIICIADLSPLAKWVRQHSQWGAQAAWPSGVLW